MSEDTETGNIKKDKIRPKQTHFPVLVTTNCVQLIHKFQQEKNNRTTIALPYPPMAFIFLILITGLLKCSFNYSRALKIVQCHLLKVKFAVH